MGEKITRIIVEGPDCSGKSSLVQRLKNRLRWDSKYLHHREENQFLRYVKEYALAENVVFDRAHVSESVYGSLWRGGSPFSEEERKILDRMNAHSSIVIFACPSLEVLHQRYNERMHPQQVKFQELERSRYLFCKEMETTPHTAYYSKDFEELETLVEKMGEKVEKLA